MSITQKVVLKHLSKQANVYQQLAEQLDFSTDFVNNLDALYDELSGNLEGPVQLTWQDGEEAKVALGREDYEALLAVFNDTMLERDDFTFILKP
jgi:ribonuclease inhibitor